MMKTRRSYPIRFLLAAALQLACMGCTTTTTGEYSFEFSEDNKSNTILDTKLAQLQEEAKKYPKRSDLPFRIASVYYQKDEYNEAVKAIHQAIEIDPGEAKYHYHLGRVYMRMHELDKAEEAFRRSIEVMPPDRFTGGHGALGYVLCQEGKWDEALEQYKLCEQIDPDDPKNYYFIGCIYDIKKDRDRAIHYLNEYLRRGGSMFRANAFRMLSSYGVVDLPEESAESDRINPDWIQKTPE